LPNFSLLRKFKSIRIRIRNLNLALSLDLPDEFWNLIRGQWPTKQISLRNCHCAGVSTPSAIVIKPTL